jgi:hypothetical protein
MILDGKATRIAATPKGLVKQLLNADSFLMSGSVPPKKRRKD